MTRQIVEKIHTVYIAGISDI